MTRLAIRRMRNRYHLPAGMVDADECVRRFDRVARNDVPDALDAFLPAALRTAGLPDDAVVFVRRLRLTLRLTGPEPAGGPLAAGWAEALLQALRRHLRHGSGGDDGVAVFDDVVAAQRRLLEMRARGAPPPWWAASLEHAGEAVEPFDVLRRWLERDAPRAWIEIAGLARALPTGLPGLLDAGQARSLLRHSLALRGERLEELGAAPPSDTVPAHGRRRFLPQPTLEERAALRAAGAELRPFVLLSFILEKDPAAPVNAVALRVEAERIARWSPLPRPDDAAAPPHPAPEATARRRGQPAVESDEDAGQASAAGSARHDPSAAAGAPADAPDARPHPAAPSDQPVTPQRPRAAAVPVQAAQDVAGAAARPDPRGRPRTGTLHHVCCGGLLFLVRPLARLPLVRDHAGDELRDRLLHVGLLALWRVFDPLRAAQCRAAFERERPLLEVFCGMRQEPGELAPAARDLVRAEAARAARAALDRVSDGVPDDVAAFEPGFRLAYGRGATHETAAPGGDGASAGVDALARLILRPGRLLVTPTQADLYLDIDAADIAVRRVGWDIDPGWVPYLGRTIRFHYEKP